MISVRAECQRFPFRIPFPLADYLWAIIKIIIVLQWGQILLHCELFFRTSASHIKERRHGSFP